MRSHTTIRTNRRRTLRCAAVVLTVAAGLTLTACNGDDVTGGDPSAASSASSTDGASSNGGSATGGSGSGGSDQGGGKDSAGKNSGGQGTAAGSGSGSSAEAGKCRTDDLDISASDSTIDGDTKGSVAVELHNGGGQDCTLSGFAGVDLTTSEGPLSAQRAGQPAERTTLKNGKSVFFNISYPMNDSGGSGVKVTGLVVTPPGETKSFSLEWPGAATLPVTDGSGSPVEVGPIGSAGQGGAS
ncbi:DUF4232 domain-containing protein [Streptomyces kunmingensis]|uniref:DUF4232 domain-containing protein n=1 Tax=Streptomyces kunmingensis TaxID=68225 RepID=A0ABU6CLX9_9ACTN|nr:DUF4232 domain-containing protein [Streptomyces kunmingensis]MEB3965729.1 DUF4232 domain-containing protein [Streptomyces kunmingensis]